MKSSSSTALALVLLMGALVVTAVSARRLVHLDEDDDEEDEQPWLNENERRRNENTKSHGGGDNAFNYEEREQLPARVDCDVDNFRRGQTECDKILRMNLPHHHGSHDYVCYSLRKYKMCIANVMIQASCYERTFISQELHKIRGIIQGYSVDCFNITKETSRRGGLKVRRLRFRVAKAKLAAECSPATAWGVELTCTRDFETDMKSLSQLSDPAKAVKKSCRTILQYYHCLTPVTESSSCQRNPDFVKHMEYFPNALTARYKEACLNELDINPSLLKGKFNASMAAVQQWWSDCKEELATKEFLACALVFNEVESQGNQGRTCEAYNNFKHCTDTIAKSLQCGPESEFHYHAVHVLSVLLFKYQAKCRYTGVRRGRSGNDGVLKEDVSEAPPAPPSVYWDKTEATYGNPPGGQATRKRRMFKRFTDQIYKATTQNQPQPFQRKKPLEPRVPKPDDYPGNHGDDAVYNQDNEQPREEPLPSNRWGTDGVAPVGNRQPQPKGNDRRKNSWDNSEDEHSSGDEDSVDTKEGKRSQDAFDDDKHSDHHDNQKDLNEAGGQKGAGDNFGTDRTWNKRGDQDKAKDQPRNKDAVENDANHDKKDDGYPSDRNDGYLEDMDDMAMEANHRKKRRLHRLH